MLQFNRKWTVNEAAFTGESYSSQNENNHLRDKLSNIERMFAQFMAQQEQLNRQNSSTPVVDSDLLSGNNTQQGTSKGKGRGKRTTRTSPPVPPPRTLLGSYLQETMILPMNQMKMKTNQSHLADQFKVLEELKFHLLHL